MKKILFFACLIAGSGGLYAQACSNPNSQIDIHGNNIRARLLNGGDMFTDFSDGQFIPNWQAGQPNPSTIYAGALWIGGLDPAFNLKLAAITYRSDGKPDYFAGPLHTDGTTADIDCSNWDRHFRVTGSEIAAFLQALPTIFDNPQAALAQFPSVMGWPGFGNPYFSSATGFDLPFSSSLLAGFHDSDDNGSYDPLKGDYPVVRLQGGTEFVPAEIVWCVFNDQGGGAPHANSFGKAFPVEVQLTAWAFNCADQPVLNNTLFTAHKIIYRGTEPVDSCFVGLWADFDIGCHLDDYLGCDTVLSTYYAYNVDASDGSMGSTCPGPSGGVATFGDAPPTQSVTFLSRTLDKFIPIYGTGINTPPSATTGPTTTLEYYRYLTGRWRDGSPMTYGGTGSGPALNYMFTDDPANPNGWSMCTANSPLYDQQGLGVHKIGLLAPGQIEEMVTAWAYHPFVDAPCSIGNTLADVESLRTHYDQQFANVCSGLTAVNEISTSALVLQPNPANDQVTLQFDGQQPVLEIRLMSNDGRLLESVRNPVGDTIMIAVGRYPAGAYLIQVLKADGISIGKLVINR